MFVFLQEPVGSKPTEQQGSCLLSALRWGHKWEHKLPVKLLIIYMSVCVCIPKCCCQSDLNIFRNLNKRVLKLILECHIQLVRAGPCLCYAIANFTLTESKLFLFLCSAWVSGEVFTKVALEKWSPGKRLGDVLLLALCLLSLGLVVHVNYWHSGKIIDNSKLKKSEE